jgi:hypothetical protein
LEVHEILLPFVFWGELFRRGIQLIGTEKARVVTEWNVANRVGWNVASLFGFVFRNVDGKAKEKWNETKGWHERNGMNGSTLAWAAEAGADNERNGTEGGGAKCSPRV